MQEGGAFWVIQKAFGEIQVALWLFLDTKSFFLIPKSFVIKLFLTFSEVERAIHQLVICAWHFEKFTSGKGGG